MSGVLISRVIECVVPPKVGNHDECFPGPPTTMMVKSSTFLTIGISEVGISPNLSIKVSSVYLLRGIIALSRSQIAISFLLNPSWYIVEACSGPRASIVSPPVYALLAPVTAIAPEIIVSMFSALSPA